MVTPQKEVTHNNMPGVSKNDHALGGCNVRKDVPRINAIMTALILLLDLCS